MKYLFLKYSLNLVKENYPNYDDNKLDEIRYGLEATYLSLTKTFVILMACFILGIIKEALLLLILFNFLRLTAFGIHATKSWMCWISSSLVFLVCPYLCIHLSIPLYILVTIASICWIIFLLYAPADTENVPILRKSERKQKQILSYITFTLGLIIAIFIKNPIISNILLFGNLIQSMMITRLAYRLTGSQYGYELYQEETSTN